MKTTAKFMALGVQILLLRAIRPDGAFFPTTNQFFRSSPSSMPQSQCLDLHQICRTTKVSDTNAHAIDRKPDLVNAQPEFCRIASTCKCSCLDMSNLKLLTLQNLQAPDLEPLWMQQNFNVSEADAVTCTKSTSLI